MTHKHRTITASSVLHLLFALNLLTNRLLPWTSTFHCSPTLTLTFQLPAALNTPLGVSLFTFHYLYLIHIRLSPQPSSQLTVSLHSGCQHVPGAQVPTSQTRVRAYTLLILLCVCLHTHICIYTCRCRWSVTAVKIRP